MGVKNLTPHEISFPDGFLSLFHQVMGVKKTDPALAAVLDSFYPFFIRSWG